MKICVKILTTIALLGFLWATGCKPPEPFDLSMQRNRIFLLGRLLVGKTCDVRLIYRVGPDEPTPVSVAADLSKIGGDAEQPLTADDSGTWRWSGQVTPDSAKEQPVLITAREAGGQEHSSKKLFPVYDTEQAVAIGGGYGVSFAVKSDGTVVAWGRNLAVESDGTVLPPVNCDYMWQCNVPATITDAVAVAGGADHSVALNADGTVVAWGKYAKDDPDKGSYVYYDMYVPEGLADVVAIVANGSYNLALKADGTVVAWGDATYGNASCGQAVLDVPVDLTDVIAIAAVGCSNFAIMHDGSVVSWGSGVKIATHNAVAVSGCDGECLNSPPCVSVLNEYGQVDLYGEFCVSFPIRAGSGFKLLIGDGRTGVALRKDGTAVSWQAGNYVGATVNEIPGGFIAIAGPMAHIALPANGRLKTWWDDPWWSILHQAIPEELQ